MVQTGEPPRHWNIALTVAAAVTEIRKRLGITQVALARLCGVHPMTVSRWERNDLQVGPWHRQLLLALVSAQPRDNLGAATL